MSITPFVYPPKDQEGVELSLEASAIFDFALDPGTINKHNVFLVKKNSSFSNNSVEPVESTVELKRLEINTISEYNLPDFGTDPNSGELYRSKIIVNPLSLLDEHTEYSLLLSKEISALSVFDPEPDQGNAGDTPLFRGPFLGLSSDVYIIEITSNGDHTDAEYQWTRLSDSESESGIKAKKRYLELDRGIFIKFPRGDYSIGDVFTLRVIPQQKINSTITWDFATGSEAQSLPEDSKSGSVVNVPVGGQSSGGGTGTGGFNLVKTTPYDGQTMVKIGKKGSVAISGIVIKTDDKTSNYNNRKVKIIEMASSSPTIYELNDEFIIEIEDTVTTNQEVTDLINNSTLPISAETSTPNAITETHLSGLAITGGQKGGVLELTFSKNIDVVNFNNDKISAFYESLVDIENGDLDFTYEITDNKLKIQF